MRERELPAADDAFAQLASEFDTIDELRDDLRTRLGRVKLLEQGYAARDKVAERPARAAIDVPMPEGVIAQQIEEHFVDGHGDDDHSAEVEAQARDGAQEPARPRQDRRDRELSVSEAELSSWLVPQAPRYGMSPDQFAQELVSAGQVPAAVAEVRRGKALALRPRARASVVDTNGTIIDLSELATSDDFDAHAGHDHEGHDHEGHDHDDHEGHDHH